jgi:cobalamin biosynthesis protein CobT
MRTIVNETTLEKTARLLMNGYNIRVVFENGPAGIKDNKTIRLPPVDYVKASAEQVNAMQGYLDNQVSKMLFSDVNKILKHSNDPLLMEIFNTIEHPRVEPALQKQYPGTEYNFQNIYEYLSNRLLTDWNNVPFVNKVLFTSFMNMRYPNHPFIKEAYSRTQDLQKNVEYILDIIKKANPQNTAESFAVAEQIKKLFSDEPPPPQQASSGKENSDKDKTSKAQSNSSSGKKAEKSGNEAGDSPAEEDSSEDSSSGQEESQGAGDTDSDNLQVDQEKLSESAKKIQSIMSMEAVLPEQKQEQQTKNKYNNFYYNHNQASDGTYIIYSTANDKIEKVTTPDFARYGQDLQTLRDKTRPQVGVIKTRLVNSLRTMQRSRWTPNKYEGKLDVKRAYKAVLGISDAVYKTKDEKLNLDVAVGLVIDQSGSMAGTKLQLASQSALVLGDVFDALKIPFLVYGHNTSEHRYSAPDYERYARFSALNLHVYSEFGDNWKKKSISLLEAKSYGCNLDGEAVRWGCQRLLSQPQKRKILIVFNDGMPNPGYGHQGRNEDFLRKVVATSTKSGVEIIAFGILDNSVQHYYPNYVVISKLEDLVKEPLVKIDGMLRKGMYK